MKKSNFSGQDSKITRRDFLNSTLLGAGAALCYAPAPMLQQAMAGSTSGRFPPMSGLGSDWYGNGGVGDYAPSHGNTPDVVMQAHDIRDGKFDSLGDDVITVDEVYDLIVVGAGIAGLGAAYEFKKTMPDTAKCLLLDNHPLFGGVAKQNEFIVNGHHLMGPQGANGFSVPDFSNIQADDYAAGDAIYYQELGIPTEFTYQDLPSAAKQLRFGNDNYGYLYWLQNEIDVSYFFDQQSHGVKPQHALNPWSMDLINTPWSQQEQAALLSWEHTHKRTYQGKDYRQWLDTMTYKDYLEKELGLDPFVASYADPILASGVGLGADVISAYAAFNVAFPGFKAYEDISISHRHSFPGGNAGFSRYFLKRLIPAAIAGQNRFEDIINGQINFEALDQAGQSMRMRLSATVVRVEHQTSSISNSEWVWVTYTKAGKVYRAKARGVVMAGGGWINKHVVRDLPKAYLDAYNQFYHAPMLVANVALTNWRFLQKLGVSGSLYRDGFGSFCNLRRPMTVGDFQPPLHPDKPAVLTFYVPFYYPGHTMPEQGLMGRMEMLTTSFADYERQIREQLTRLYGDYGFNPSKDIAAIVLNRWGHAYVTPQPGFYFGRDGKPAPRDVVSERFGRITFAHSELRGNQHWGPAAMEGRRAIKQLREVV
jgi:spermidine dehydrogenase